MKLTEIKAKIKQSQTQKTYFAFQRYLKGNRRIVQRSAKRYLKLARPDKPIPYDVEDLSGDSLNLNCARFYDPETFNDGCIISKSAAERFLAFKESSLIIKVPKNSTTEWNITESPWPELQARSLLDEKSFKNLEGVTLGDLGLKDLFPEYGNSVIKMGQHIGTTVTHSGREILHHAKIRAPHGAVVKKITQQHYNDVIAYHISWITIYRMEIGDKLMNQTGHKFTISRIADDNEMPVLDDGTRIDIIIPFEVGKRCTPATFLEEIYSRLHQKNIKYTIDTQKSAAELYQEGIAKLGESHCKQIRWRGKDINVPYGIIRFFRIDNIPSETYKWTVKTKDQSNFNPDFGVKFNWNMLISLYTRGAHNLVKYISAETPQVSQKLDALDKVLHGEISDVELINLTRSITLDSDLDVSTMYAMLTDREAYNSILDPRLEKAFGKIDTFDEDGTEIAILVPPVTHPTFATHKDKLIIAKVLIQANRLIEISNLYRRNKDEKILENLLQTRADYNNAIITLAKDVIREMNNPVMGQSLYAVFSGNIKLDIDQIGIPERIYNAFYKKNKPFRESADKRVLLWRQPVHSHGELVSMRAVPVESNTIQINPHIIGVLEGDLDGDCGFVMVPHEEEAYRDLDKLDIRHVINRFYDEPNFYKRIVENFDVEFDQPNVEKWDMIYTTMTHPDLIGISSWPDHMEFERTDKFYEFWEAKDNKYFTKDIQTSAWEMAQVKEGTAQAGGIALAFIAWLWKVKGDRSDLGLEFYKLLAENALSAKSGDAHLISKFNEVYVKARDGKLKTTQDEINKMVEDLIVDSGESPENYPDLGKLFYEFVKEKSQAEDYYEFLNNIDPLFAILRHRGGAGGISEIIKNRRKFIEV